MKGTSLAVQWLRLQASTEGGAGSIPGRGTQIPHAAQPKKIKEDCHQGGLRARQGFEEANLSELEGVEAKPIERR